MTHSSTRPTLTPTTREPLNFAPSIPNRRKLSIFGQRPHPPRGTPFPGTRAFIHPISGRASSKTKRSHCVVHSRLIGRIRIDWTNRRARAEPIRTRRRCVFAGDVELMEAVSFRGKLSKWTIRGIGVRSPAERVDDDRAGRDERDDWLWRRRAHTSKAPFRCCCTILYVCNIGFSVYMV